MRKYLLGTTAVLAGLTVAAAAHAQQAITGGGSTLASPSYLEEFTLFQGPNDGYDFTDYYTPEGSGSAQASVLTNNPSGFDFGASDATINTTQLNSWNTSGTGKSAAGLLVEIPMIGTPITIPVNLPASTSNGGVALTDAQLCGIFSGKYTTWSAAGVNGVSGSSNNITVAYRGDNSGTSFLFTQHLAAVCTSSTSNITFTATQSFASLFANNTPPGNFAAYTGNSTKTGSPAVQYTVASTSGAVGYLSPDYTRVAATPNLAPGVTSAPYVASVNGVVPSPTTTQAALATGTPVPLNPGDAPDTTSDPNTFIPVAANPSAGYPIVGYTTWLLPQCFSNASVAAGIKGFLSSHYSNASFKAIYNNAGFSTVPAGLASVISRDYLAGGASSVINGSGTGGCASVAGR